MRSSLRPHPTSPELRTVAVREGPFSMDKSHLKLVAPAEVNRIVAPTRRPNAELRTREHLTPGEVEAAKANRHGHRDATMILLAFRDGLRAAELIALAQRRGRPRVGSSATHRLHPARPGGASGDGNLGNGHPMAYVDKLQTGLAGARSPFKDRIPVPDDRPRSFAINIDPRQE
jgi:hypothetical protein